MLQKVIKILIVISSFVFVFGCGTITAGITAGTALSTVGTAAAAKAIQHTAGYGIQSPHTIIERVMPSVVTVSVEIQQSTNSTTNSNRRRFVKPGEQMPQPGQPQVEPFSSGSGFVVGEAGVVITNWHVIQNAINHKSIIRVTFSNHAIYEATIFNYDKISDVAVLHIKNDDNEKFQVVEWGDRPKLGGHAIVIGSPIGLDFSVSFGIISAIDRTIPRAAPPFVPYIQTDASMNRGNSGGPLFNAEGKVIGINTLILSPGSNSGDGGGSIGLGFAVDGQYVQNIISRLSKGEKIKWAYLGIHYRLLDRKETKSNNLKFGENVIVVKITEDGAAFGLLQENDIIQKMNGEIVHHTNFATMIAKHAPTDIIKLKVLRDGKIIDVDLTLKERPEGY